MSVTVEKLSSNRVKLSFEVDVETFSKAMNESYRKNVGKIAVPGFRRGKAPRRVVENMYGEEIFFEDAIDAIFPTVYQAAIDEHKLKPVDQPEIEWGNIGGGKPLAFTLEVFVSPDVTLGDLTGLEAERAEWEVTDAQIDSRMETDRNRVARWVEVERSVQTGDRATIDYAGSIDGVAFEGGTAESMPLDIGSGTFIPGFEEQVVGMSAGEEKDINVSFPEDYRAEDLAGKEAVFHVKVHEVKAKEMPELDDEFAQDVSEFDTLEEYKRDIRSKLEETAKRSAQARSDNSLIRSAVAVCEMDIPEPMVERQIDNMLREFSMNLMYQGMSLEGFMQMTGQTMETFRENYRVDALARVKAELVIEAVRERESFEPSQERIDDEIAKVAADMGRDVETFKETMGEREKEYITDAAASEMVLELLRSTAVFVDPKPEDEHDHDHDDHDHHGHDHDHDHAEEDAAE